MATEVKVAATLEEAREAVQAFSTAGYGQDHVYVLTHDGEGTDFVAYQTGANEPGVKEEGFMNALANLFRSKGDQLRSKLESLGVGEAEAADLEKELDKGKIVVVASR